MQWHRIPVRFSFFSNFSLCLLIKKMVGSCLSPMLRQNKAAAHTPRGHVWAGRHAFFVRLTPSPTPPFAVYNRIFFSLVGCSGAGGNRPLGRATRAASGQRFAYVFDIGLCLFFLCANTCVGTGQSDDDRAKKGRAKTQNWKEQGQKVGKKEDRTDDNDDDGDDTNSRRRSGPTMGHIAT
ncbi:hypothetical protein TW95_gp0301 [Pandoravirus inopinatum]|uniref:Uncharacterized protein n=1 Tax=Pandoravirus inopinatum TaxID=1605721 RepID=A0A0B5J5S2_9VIRU|nr:hypothetical protein TW95_gp0301 [Pandoravirus inopinatum]AJF97035.1 hypothetical protein [Pandoravirus inopinatum]